MTKGTNETTNNDDIRLERSIRKLNAALAQHLSYLNKHATAMENLTQAMKQLEATFKRVIKLDSQIPSQQLKEAVSAFVDFHINPRYYHEKDMLQIKAASPSEVAPSFKVTPLNKEKVPSIRTLPSCDIPEKDPVIMDPEIMDPEIMDQEIDDTDQDMENLYLLALKKAIKDFKGQD
jgi:hypothetical protein